MADQNDIIIIGAGFAGVAAARFSIQKKCKVQLISTNQEMSQHFSGSFDLLANPYSKVLQSPLGMFDLEQLLLVLVDQNPQHIYSRIFSSIRDDVFCRGSNLPQLLAGICSDFFSFYNIKIKGDGRSFLRVLTAAGQMKSTAFALDSIATLDELRAATQVSLVNICGLKDYPVGVLKKLCDQLGLSAVVIDVNLPKRKIDFLSTLDVAATLETPEGLAHLLDQLPGNEGGIFLFPPVLGVQKHEQIRAAIYEKTKSPSFETLSQIPSVPGLRLKNQIHSVLKQNVNYIHQELIGLEETAAGVTLKLKNGDQISCQDVIMATGKRDYLQKRRSDIKKHTLLGLDYFDGNHYIENKTCEQLTQIPESAPQRLYRGGVNYNKHMNPIDKEKEVRRVRICGHLLSGFDFAAEHCGFGASVFSAWAATRFLDGKRNYDSK